jgi:hypothetical protein
MGSGGGLSTGPVEYSPCARDARIGSFEVEIASDHSQVQGQVRAGVVPGDVPEVLDESGSCALLSGRSLFCDPGCGPGETCSTDGTCIAYPENVSVGTVTIEGLADAVSLEPRAPIQLYSNSGTLTHPAAAPGDPVRLSAAGGDYDAFSLRGQGVEALVPSDEAMLVESGSPVFVSWDAPGESTSADVHLELNINNHGSTLAYIACDVPDTGSAEIPASLVTGLIDIGFSGFPTIVIRRQTIDSANTELGCVEFSVGSGLSLDVTVDGVVSCNDDGDCESMDCQEDLTCAE